MKSVCIFASLGVAAADMKGRMVVDAHGDIVESSFVDMGEDPVEAPETNSTALDTEQQTELAKNDTAQAIVDMENDQQMTQQMDAYLRRKNAQLAAINTRYDQVKAYYAMLDLHGKLVDTLTGRFDTLAKLIDERTEIENRAIGAFIKITQNLAQMNVLYTQSQMDNLIPAHHVPDSAWQKVLEIMSGPLLNPDTILADFGFLAATLHNNDDLAGWESSIQCMNTNNMAQNANPKLSCEMSKIQYILEGKHEFRAESENIPYRLSQITGR